MAAALADLETRRVVPRVNDDRLRDERSTPYTDSAQAFAPSRVNRERWAE